MSWTSSMQKRIALSASTTKLLLQPPHKTKKKTKKNKIEPFFVEEDSTQNDYQFQSKNSRRTGNAPACG
jgi:hypothetical protein